VKANVPYEFWTKISMSIRLRWEENVALHSYLTNKGCFQLEDVVDAELPNVAEFPLQKDCNGCYWGMGSATVKTLASCQSTTKCLARSTTVVLTSVNHPKLEDFGASKYSKTLIPTVDWVQRTKFPTTEK